MNLSVVGRFHKKWEIHREVQVLYVEPARALNQDDPLTVVVLVFGHVLIFYC